MSIVWCMLWRLLYWFVTMIIFIIFITYNYDFDDDFDSHYHCDHVDNEVCDDEGCDDYYV